MTPLRTMLLFTLAAIFEIAGCYTAWMWLRLGRSPLWLGAGVVLLVLFALTLTRVETAFAGRAFAAYGGVFIAAALGWAALVENRRPDVADVGGALVCIAGAAIIAFGRR
jgi:small multidrug resistance family-3 protein